MTTATSSSPNSAEDRARKIWFNCLGSALRTALACAIVGAVTLYGPKSIAGLIGFPAFSYVTVILIVTDATLGHTVRGCWLGFYATAQTVGTSIVALWLIGPGRFTKETTAVAVGLSAFVVALPENTHLIAKRIALGQIVIVYVIGFINGEKTDALKHPLLVASSTALGVVACVLAMVFPYPKMACWEVKRSCKQYIKNASDRLQLLMKAFSAQDKASPKTLMSQATCLNYTAKKLLADIKSKQEIMNWERLPFKKSHNKNPGDKLQHVETVLRGMKNAVSNCSEFPIRFMYSELETNLIDLQNDISNQEKSIILENSILPQSNKERYNKFLQTLQIKTSPLAINFQDLPSMFFIFCLSLLQPKSASDPLDSNASAKQASEKSKTLFASNLWNHIIASLTINRNRLMPALRCSLSLGFAVYFGLTYSKENGYWAGLPVAISLASSRVATFKVANVKAQGTVLGTVFGVMGCFLFEQYVKVRFVALIPWFLFASFLRKSKMYGQAGGVSAVIGAVLILGRKNFGTPSDFAIARIIETFIGLSCSIMVDMLLQPTRACVLAKEQLVTCQRSLNEAVKCMNLGSSNKESSLKKLKSQVNGLGNFIDEAEVEPDFWFLPFNSGCYKRLKLSLSKMVDYLTFANHAIESLGQESMKMCGNAKTTSNEASYKKLESDLKICTDAACSGIKCFEEVILVKSLFELETEFEKRKESVDLEMGKLESKPVIQWLNSYSSDGEVMRNTYDSFFQHLDEVVEQISEEEEDGKVIKNQVIVSACALIFCINGLLKEMSEIEKAVIELVQWENPTSKVDLHDILCKLRVLKKCLI